MKTAEEQNNIAAKQQTFQLRRRKARCLAMQFIFQMDMNKQCRCDQEQLSRFQETWLEDENQRKAWKYARKIIEATCENLEEIDRLLQKAASNWSLPRMSYIDRSIMRIAVSEIAFTEKKTARHRHQRSRRAGQNLQRGRIRRLRQRHTR